MYFLGYLSSCMGWPDEKCEGRGRARLPADILLFQEYYACFQGENVKMGQL
jgi:hypothetical protein